MMDSIEIIESDSNTTFTDDLDDSSLTSQNRRRRDPQEDNSDETFTNLEDSSLISRYRSQQEAQENDSKETFIDLAETEKSYHSALIFMVFFATIGIVLVLATVPVDHTLSPAPGHAVVKIIRIMYDLFVSCVYIWFLRIKMNPERKEIVCRSQSYVRKSIFPRRDKLQHLPVRGMSKRKAETHFSVIGAIIVLGCGSLVLNFTYIIKGIYCLTSLMERKPTVSEAIYPISYASFSFIVVIQMAFFKAFDGITFKSRPMIHNALAVWIAADWWGWFAMTATPLIMLITASPNYVTNSTYDSRTNESYMCSDKQTELFRFVKVLETYLQPLNIEYLTVSIGVLFQLWGTMTNVDVKRQISESDITPFLGDGQIDVESVISIRPYLTFKGIFKKHICVIVGSSVLGLINLVLQIVISEQFGITNSHRKHIETDDDEHKFETTVPSVIIWLLTLFLLLPTLLLFIPCTRILKHPIPGKYSLGMNNFLLLFTSAFVFIYDLLRLGAVAGLMQQNTKRGYLMALFGLAISIGNTLQTYMQTKFLITVQRNKARDERLNERNLSFLLHVSITNAFYWFIISFAHESHTLIFAPVMNEFYSSDQSGKTRMKVIGLVCTPFWCLYRFHSAILAYELVKGRSKP